MFPHGEAVFAQVLRAEMLRLSGPKTDSSFQLYGPINLPDSVWIFHMSDGNRVSTGTVLLDTDSVFRVSGRTVPGDTL